MTDQSHGDRRFSSDEAGEIIERATRLSQHNEVEGLSYDDLIEVASEVGIDKQDVDDALAQAKQEEMERQAAAETPPAWRSVADRCLEILCLKPVNAERTPAP